MAPLPKPHATPFPHQEKKKKIYRSATDCNSILNYRLQPKQEETGSYNRAKLLRWHASKETIKGNLYFTKAVSRWVIVASYHNSTISGPISVCACLAYL